MINFLRRDKFSPRMYLLKFPIKKLFTKNTITLYYNHHKLDFLENYKKRQNNSLTKYYLKESSLCIQWIHHHIPHAHLYDV